MPGLRLSNVRSRVWHIIQIRGNTETMSSTNHALPKGTSRRTSDSGILICKPQTHQGESGCGACQALTSTRLNSPHHDKPGGPCRSPAVRQLHRASRNAVTPSRGDARATSSDPLPLSLRSAPSRARGRRLSPPGDEPRTLARCASTCGRAHGHKLAGGPSRQLVRVRVGAVRGRMVACEGISEDTGT